MTDKPVIEERENGPLVVKGVSRMVGPDGAEVEVKPVMALCRCGASKSKPFCDGTHNEIGFQSRGGTPAGKDVVLSYKGASVTVLYNPLVCSHAAECVTMAPKAFDPDRRPWIDPDAEDAATLESVVRACPSGALRIEGQDHLIPDGAQITIAANGPYCVLGMEIDEKIAGEGATADKKVLCRCGQSGNKPYCDGTHRDAGWKDG
ncbi:MAG: CDGSH iron-sulfur domain-containing protein [Rhodobacter sp.]|nr:CDGSH iron-sulfur domain-containing protein [Rhodobacter sp.]